MGEYQLHGRLGSGGMGRVYLGATRAGRPVAVKVIYAHIAEDPSFRNRLQREVAAARQVGGFWTASVVAADPHADPPWLATEYIAGPTLFAAVSAAGPLPAATASGIAVRLLEALAAIHHCGLVHRDLKPGNVLLGIDGPKVIDFGLARPYLTDTAPMTSIIGTPGYMAPEQIRGEALYPAVDVFAFGATLVYALLGRGPFDAGSPSGVLHRVLMDPADLTGTPAQLRPVLAACLEKDPASRPTTSDLLDQLAPTGGARPTPYQGWQPPAHDPARTLLSAAAGQLHEQPTASPTFDPTRLDQPVQPEQEGLVVTRPAGESGSSLWSTLLVVAAVAGLFWAVHAGLSAFAEGMTSRGTTILMLGTLTSIVLLVVATLLLPKKRPAAMLHISPAGISGHNGSHQYQYTWDDISKVTVRRYSSGWRSPLGLYILPQAQAHASYRRWTFLCNLSQLGLTRATVEQALARSGCART